MGKKIHWPAMRYHPETGAYVICDTEDDVPEGYVSSLRDVKDPDAELTEDKAPAPKKTAKKTKAPKNKKAPKRQKVEEPTADAVTLESLDITRESADELLTEEGVDFDADASDDDIAALVAELIAD